MNIAIKISVVIFVVLAVYCVAQYIRSRHYVDIGIGLANVAVPYEQHPADANLRFLVIGDSTAVGTGASKPQDSTAGQLGAQYPTADIINKGVNGAKTHELPDRFAEFEDKQFDLVLVQIGGNDIVRFTNLTDVETNLRAILAEADRVGKQVIILHCGDFGTAKLLPVGTRWIFSRRTEHVRAIYQRVTPDYNAMYVDLWRKDNNDPFADEPNMFYAVDYFHPSSAGYADWYAHIQQNIKPF